MWGGDGRARWEGEEKRGRESCHKCRPERAAMMVVVEEEEEAFPWKQSSQQSVTSSVRWRVAREDQGGDDK